ncbi:MAG: ABC-three component system middle component 5 [Aestuariivirga sp.]
MTQLVYHPAFDPYNCLLRIVRILLELKEGGEAATIRMLDFYLLFPENISKARLTTSLRSAVGKLKLQSRFPYDRMPAARTLLERMNPAFEASLQTLITKGLVAKPEKDHRLFLQKKQLPEELLNLALKHNKDEKNLMEILSALAREFPVQGPNGLKDRSGLMEFRYDVL